MLRSGRFSIREICDCGNPSRSASSFCVSPLCFRARASHVPAISSAASSALTHFVAGFSSAATSGAYSAARPA